MEFVAIDILRTLPKTTNLMQLIVVITDRNTKGAREIPSSKTTMPLVVSICFKHWIIQLRIYGLLLTNNGPQIVCKIFWRSYALPSGFKPLITVALHLQFIWETEGHNRTIKARLQHYFAYPTRFGLNRTAVNVHVEYTSSSYSRNDPVQAGGITLPTRCNYIRSPDGAAC